MNYVQPSRRRKRRPMNGVKTVDVVRGKLGYGFTISGQSPCTLNYIVSGSPAEAIGLKSGDFLLAVNGENVSNALHDDVVRMIGTSLGTLTLQVAENVNYSDSSDEDIPQRQKSRHPHRLRARQSDGVLKDCNCQPTELATEANRNNPQISESLVPSALVKKKVLSGALRRDVWEQENSSFTMQESNLSFRNVYSHSQGSQLTSNQKVNKDNDWPHRNTAHPKESCSSLNAKIPNRMQATRNVDSSRQCEPCNSTTSDDVEESDEEWLSKGDPNVVKHFVVGYLGTIEMPADKNSQHARLQSFHSAVRRLRLEKKIHTLVALTISVTGVKLTNAVRKVLAEYPVHRIVFCGISPDDNLYFGIVTSNCSSVVDPIKMGYKPSFSCHVFKINPDIHAHYMHAQKARMFQFECTRSQDLRHCFEFPQTAVPVIGPISSLYRDKQNIRDNFPITQLFHEPASTPAQNVSVNSSASSGSNSDSGLGFGRDDSHNEGVFVVDMNQHSADQSTRAACGSKPRHLLSSAQHHLSLPLDSMATPHSAFQSTNAGNSFTQTKITSNKEDPKEGRLTLRAMPDPVLDLSSTSEVSNRSISNAPTTTNNNNNSNILSHKYRSKLNGEHRSRSRETISKMSSYNSRSSSLERNPESRPLSAPYYQLSSSKLAAATCPSNSDFLDKLSPRAIPDNSKFKIRSPSAPPPGCVTVEDSGFEKNVRRPLEEIFAIFDQDRNSESSSETVRRFSEGFSISNVKADAKPPVRSGATHKWRKVGSFRRPKISKLSHSHESLVATGNDVPLCEKMAAANSISSINHTGGGDGGGKEVSRVASWAVSFNRLLDDPSGVQVFTDFLLKEFSEENIHFWLAVDDFKKSVDGTKILSVANHIFQKHLSPGASEPVNVDSSARQMAEQQLNKPSSTMFDAAQQQIFQLMKQDSYARFLKSELYKTHLMAEMESKLATSRTAVFTAISMMHSKAGKDADKKYQKGKEEEKRRWSLLPWKQKSSKPTEGQKFRKFSKDESKKRPSLATMDLSLMRKEVVQGRESLPGTKDVRFCRVLLPDNSTAVVCAKHGQSIQQVLSHLFDKRNLTLDSTEVFLLGSDKPLDLSEDMSVLGSKEVLVERRTFFRVKLPCQKVIGVKAKPSKLIYDVFRPILQKYGVKIDNMCLQLATEEGQQGVLDVQIPVSSIADHQILVTPKQDLSAILLHVTTLTTTTTPTAATTTTTTFVGSDRNSVRPNHCFMSPPPEPPPPPSTPAPTVVEYGGGGDGDSDADTVAASNRRAARLSHSASLEEITNKVFEDLMLSKLSGCGGPATPLHQGRAACQETTGAVLHCLDTCAVLRRDPHVIKRPPLPHDQLLVRTFHRSNPFTPVNHTRSETVDGGLAQRRRNGKGRQMFAEEGTNICNNNNNNTQDSLVNLKSPIPAPRETSKIPFSDIPKPKPCKKPTNLEVTVGTPERVLWPDMQHLHSAKLSANASCMKTFKTFGSPSKHPENTVLSPVVPNYNKDSVRGTPESLLTSIGHLNTIQFLDCSAESSTTFTGELLPSTPLSASSPRRVNAPIASPEDLTPTTVSLKTKRFQKPLNQLGVSTSPLQLFQDSFYSPQTTPLPQTARKQDFTLTSPTTSTYKGLTHSPAPLPNGDHPPPVPPRYKHHPASHKHPSPNRSTGSLLFHLPHSETHNVSVV